MILLALIMFTSFCTQVGAYIRSRCGGLIHVQSITTCSMMKVSTNIVLSFYLI